MKILFVCLGNICRSPMAEGIMKKLVREQNLDWQVDSAGTESYHIGESPDPRAIRTCKKFGIDITDQRARRVTKKDFGEFDLIYVMATDVLEELWQMNLVKPSSRQPKPLLDELYPGQHRSVHDPYSDEEAAFEPVFRLIEEACSAIIAKYAARADLPL